ncbi:MAG: hypothetical protein K6A76_02460 [Oribacterium sp.]|nr:hypothetical protein [Oribacterium sp.]
MKLIDHKNDNSRVSSEDKSHKHPVHVKKYRLSTPVVFAILIISLVFLNSCDTGVPEAATEAWETEETTAKAKPTEEASEETVKEAEEKTEAPVVESVENSEPIKPEPKEIVKDMEKLKDEVINSFMDKTKETEAIKTWKTYDSLEEAQNASGLIVSDKVRRGLKQYNHIEYRALEGTMIELVYTDKNGKEGYRFRQGYGTNDVSGVDKKFDEENDYKMGNIIVHTRGNNGHIAIASYTDGKLSYAFIGKEYQPPLLELVGIYALIA